MVLPLTVSRYESSPLHIDNRRWDPVTATASSLAATSTGMATSAADIFVKPIQAFSRHSSSKGSVKGETASDAASVTSDDTFGRPAGLDVPSSSNSRAASPSRNPMAEAVKGSASGVGGFFKHWSKGMFLDMPLAVTEGMRNAPKLYGGEVYEPGAVTDWKSGGMAAGKNFTHGMVEGFGGLVMSPIRGAKKDGALGAAKGAGVGLLNMGTKVSSGIVGLVALSGQGVYQSARATMKRDTRKSIKEARRAEGPFMVMTRGGGGGRVDEGQVVRAFDRLLNADRDAVAGDR